uniref:Uncharacterized protein n=1 Tax=Eutreptiella gymnastica TaxID=73025 RepID=A0A7S1NE48_9EUGL
MEGLSIRYHLTSMSHGIGSRGFMETHWRRRMAYSACGVDSMLINACMYISKCLYSLYQVQGQAEDSALQCWWGRGPATTQLMPLQRASHGSEWVAHVGNEVA